MKFAQDLPFHDPDAPQLVGLSGGKDSTGLALWLTKKYGDADLRFVHVRHGLRDDSLDAAAAKATAEALGRPFIEVPAAWDKVRPGSKGEDAARQARFEAFDQVARGIKSHVLYLGHTADDQAETILMRLIRGTGPHGVTGMDAYRRYGRMQVYRPLLHMSRADVRAMAEGLPTVEDPTNTDMSQQRAFIRHQVMPLLAQARPDGQPPTQTLVSFAELIAEQNYLLEHLLPSRRSSGWCYVSRIPELGFGYGNPEVRWHIHQVLGYGVTRRLVCRVEGLGRGERLDLPGNRWAARDKFGLVIGYKGVPWEIRQGDPKDGLVSYVSPAEDPIVTCPMPWAIPIHQAIDLNNLAVRLREPQDSAHKKIFERFPKSLREQLPVVYTKDTNEVVAIGPFSLQTRDVPLAAMQWISLSPDLSDR